MSRKTYTSNTRLQMDPFALKQESDAVLRQDSSLSAVEADRSGAREVVISKRPSEGVDRLYAPGEVAEELFSPHITTSKADPNWLMGNFPSVGNHYTRTEGELFSPHTTTSEADSNWQVGNFPSVGNHYTRTEGELFSPRITTSEADSNWQVGNFPSVGNHYTRTEGELFSPHITTSEADPNWQVGTFPSVGNHYTRTTEGHFSGDIITGKADPNRLGCNVRVVDAHYTRDRFSQRIITCGTFSPVGNHSTREEELESEMNEMRKRLDGRDREIAQLRKSLSDRERKLGEVNEMQKRLDRKDREIAQLRESVSGRERERGEVSELRKRLDSREREIAQLRKSLYDRERELGEVSEMRKRLDRRDREIALLREGLSDRKRELGEANEMRKRLDRRDSEIAQLRESLSDRERELGETKKTLCMYDDCESEVNIADMMNGINTRIQSLSRNAAQRWCRGISKRQGGGGDNKLLNETKMETLKRIVGPQLANALGNHPPERNPYIVALLQLAWQASTVSVVEEILSSFVAGLATSPSGRTLDSQLQTISGSVKEGEIQPAYGRWRYVTHQYLKRRIPHDQAVQYYVKEALHHCRVAARLALRSSCPDDQTFNSTFQAQLTAIMEDAFKLQGSIQGKMLTADYESYLPSNGTPFREEFMEVDKADEVFPKDTVVCTTRLGVTLSRKKGRENSWDVEKEVFLKAQVLTECNLTDILG